MAISDNRLVFFQVKRSDFIVSDVKLDPINPQELVSVVIYPDPNDVFDTSSQDEKQEISLPKDEDVLIQLHGHMVHGEAKYHSRYAEPLPGVQPRREQ